MDAAVEAVLRDYEQRAADEGKRLQALGTEGFKAHRDEFLLAVGPGSGGFLRFLITETRARSILEIGTSYGYSTIWLGDAARETGGKVITLEIDPAKQKYAREQTARAGLTEFVDFREGDARETIASLSLEFDFVFIDLWGELYIPCFDLVYPKLRPGALILADNMILPAAGREHAAKYRAHVRAKPDIQSLLLPVGVSATLGSASGVEVSRYTRGLDRWFL